MANIIQLISDIHLDVRKHEMEIPASAPTLVVAGDIASHKDPKLRDYLGSVFRNFKYGVYVPGNHEIWGAEYPLSYVHSTIERVCNSLPTPITLLRAGVLGFDIPETHTRIVGATLWTHLPPEMSTIASSMLNDFKYIRTSATNGRLTVGAVNMMHETDKKWITSAIHEAGRDGKRAVVVTHHSPDTSLSVFNDPKAINGMGAFYFADDMRGVMKMPNIAAWLYGHTHEARISRLNGIRYPFVTNALGYPHESTGYAAGVKIRVE